MKNKIILVILLIYLLCLPFINGQTLEEYRQLSASEQLETMIEIYGFDRNGSRRLQFDQWYDILMEKPDELKPLLFEYLKEYPVVQYSNQDQRFLIMNSLLWGGFINHPENLTDSDRSIFLEIYREKIDRYLRAYKLLDSISLMLCDTERGLTGQVLMSSTMSYAEELLKKYKKLGYCDIAINYTELEYMGFE